MSSVNLLVPYKLKEISHLINQSQNQYCSFTVVVALMVVGMGVGGDTVMGEGGGVIL